MNKVVTFERSANYLHRRALKNRRQDNLLDALELLRRALELEPGNVEYQMDMAELLCEMGCHRASNRLLLEVLREENAPSECYFGMCCNFLSLRETKAAYSAMLRFLALDPEALGRSEVGETLATLVSGHLEHFSMPRKKQRSQRFFERAQQALLEGDMETGQALLSRCLEFDPEAQEARAMRALCFLEQGDLPSALRESARSVATKAPLAFKTRCVAAHVLGLSDQLGWSKKQIDKLKKRDLEPQELRMLIHIASELKLHKQVLELSALAIKQTPYDPVALHLRAAALVNLEQPQQDAQKCWSRIVRIDPLDTVASYYLAASECGRLGSVQLPYQFQVPEDECERRAASIRSVFEKGEQGIKAQWESSQKFRSLLLWALDAGNSELTQEVIKMFASIHAIEAELGLRELLIRPDTPHEHKISALIVLLAPTMPKPILMRDASGHLVDAFTNEGEQHLRPGLRRILRQIAQAQQPRDHRSSKHIDLLIRRYLRRDGAWLPKLRNPAGWAAALTVQKLKLMDNQESVVLLSEVFGCTRRKTQHCMRRLNRMLREDETNP